MPAETAHESQPIRSILIAKRSEIAIRVLRAAAEMRIGTIAIYWQQDRQALHRFKADESYLVGEGRKLLAAYLDGDDILRVIEAGIRWIGPTPAVMRILGNKVAARELAGVFSLGCWGGATFDVALRFLKEDPWQRLTQLRAQVPTCCSRCCCAARTRSATPTTPITWCAISSSRRRSTASICSASLIR